MGIKNENIRNNYFGDGATNEFDFTFKVDKPENLKVDVHRIGETQVKVPLKQEILYSSTFTMSPGQRTVFYPTGYPDLPEVDEEAFLLMNFGKVTGDKWLIWVENGLGWMLLL